MAGPFFLAALFCSMEQQPSISLKTEAFRIIHNRFAASDFKYVAQAKALMSARQAGGKACRLMRVRCAITRLFDVESQDCCSFQSGNL